MSASGRTGNGCHLSAQQAFILKCYDTSLNGLNSSCRLNSCCRSKLCYFFLPYRRFPKLLSFEFPIVSQSPSSYGGTETPLRLPVDYVATSLRMCARALFCRRSYPASCPSSARRVHCLYNMLEFKAWAARR